ncbi:histidine phosphatase family protein [Bacillus sp. FJAT-49732]|uniref:Histidine phosphatase family protein n=1 Tax=Lederbergia citrisecunda TaxID=2833583 RepID=A0A942TT83_9BACI|nr:histidine phosphatase family protein [Lederbergia citrisecunda]
MLTFYITRHGETEWNVQIRMQGWGDSALTENGIRNAILLGKRLEGVDFHAIYSSTSKRTQATSELIRGNRDIPIFFDEKLREIHMGDWEGKTRFFLEEHDAENFHAFWNTPHLYVPTKGEKFLELQERVLKAIDEIKQTYESGNVLIVTHTAVIKVLLAFIKKLSIENVWDPPYIHDTSLTLIEFDGDEGMVVLEGDVSHWGKSND